MSDIDWKAWALAMCRLLDEIDSAGDDQTRALCHKRFDIAREHGLTVEFEKVTIQ